MNINLLEKLFIFLSWTIILSVYWVNCINKWGYNYMGHSLYHLHSHNTLSEDDIKAFGFILKLQKEVILPDQQSEYNAQGVFQFKIHYNLFWPPKFKTDVLDPRYKENNIS